MLRPLILIAFATLLSGCQSAQGSSQPTSSQPTSVQSRWAATAVGRIDSADEARQLVASTDGVIARVLVERGDTVALGQPLLEIDCAPRLAEAQARRADAVQAARAAGTASSGTVADRAIAKAAIDAAAASLANEQARLLRAEEIHRRGFISRADYDAQVQSRLAAQANLQAARARLMDLDQGRRPAETAEAASAAAAAQHHARAATVQARQCTVRSPVSGQVLQILRREGEHSGASQGAPLIVVGDLSRLVVRAEIGERDAAAVQPGQRAEVWIEGKDQRWRGKVSHVASIMGRRSARSLDPTDRFDRDIREVFITFDDATDGATPPALVGLRVTVGLVR